MNDRTKLLIANVCVVLAIILAVLGVVALATDAPALLWAKRLSPLPLFLALIAIVLRIRARRDG